jgi:hypothetical protein
MNYIFRVLAVLGVLLVGIAWSAMGPNPATPEIEIVSAEFGLFNSPLSGKPPFVPSTVVPFQEGQAYGWIIQIKTTEPNVKWREEFTLPATPQTWAVRPGNHTVSPDRKTSVIE